MEITRKPFRANRLGTHLLRMRVALLSPERARIRVAIQNLEGTPHRPPHLGCLTAALGLRKTHPNGCPRNVGRNIGLFGVRHI
eukprot:8184160-Lingulodinium_polyedra.AAC.1